MTNKDYDTFGNKNTEMFTSLFGESLFGKQAKSVVIHDKNSIGYRILNNLREDEEGKRVEELEKKRKRLVGPILPYQEETFLNLSDIKEVKEDFHGLGYDPSSDLGRVDKSYNFSWTVQ